MARQTVSTRLLTHYARPKERQKPIITVDIETVAIGKGTADERDFIIGAYSRQDDEEITLFHNAHEWLDAILARSNRGYTWYAHNGGEFDYKYLLAAIRERQRIDPELRVKTVTQGNSGRLIGLILKYKKQRHELRDSFALVSSSLAKFAGQFSTTYQKQDPIDWATTRFDPHNREHMRYLQADVLALKAALIGFFAIIEEHFDVPPAWTIAATAMRAWRHTLPRGWGFWRQRREVEDFCRSGYYGGLVFLTTIAKQHDAAAVDVNSMYPFVMRKFGVPTGTAIYVNERDRNYPGFYRVQVKCPENVPFTCIPYKDPATNALTWPTGEFETTISSVDWDLAEPLGYEFTVVEGFEFERVEHIFTPFVNKCEKLRLGFPKGSAVEGAAKILQNGLYGKFGSKSESKSYVLGQPDGDDYTPVIDPRTGREIEGLYEKDEEVEVPYIMPHWAAWITAQARAHLVGLIRSIGFGRVYYGDTDSITADRAAIEEALSRGDLVVGTPYGAVKLEHEYDEFMPRAPKLYIGKETDGHRVVKAKGIPRRLAVPEHVEAYFEAQASGILKPLDKTERARLATLNEGYDHETGLFLFDSVNATMSVLKRQAAFYERRVRTLSQIEHSRGWQVVDHTTGRVRPVHFGPRTPEQAKLETG